ncbi:hypothetical protein MTO96_026884 [Rhipicephalus appendiculatus]
MLAFAPVAILAPYLVANIIKSEGGAFTVVLVVFVVGGPVAFTLFGFVYEEFGYWITRTAFMSWPPFGLSQSIAQAILLGERSCLNPDMKSSPTTAHRVKNGSGVVEKTVFGFGASYIVEAGVVAGIPGETCGRGLFSLSKESVLADIGILLCQGLFLFTAVSLLHSGYNINPFTSFSAARRRDGEQAALDEDVRAEKEFAERLAAVGASPQLEEEGYTLVAHDLYKSYGFVKAVRGISLALRRAECFGLLGVNGAGKTTAFQMLAGLLYPTSGDAYMSKATLSTSRRKWQSYIGYCPQSNGLLDKLNAFEVLRLFARLRGVPECNVEAAVRSVIAHTDLDEHADKRCGVYSGGNKRKLSVAVALLGNPRVLFFDEPYAGVDVIARNKISARIARMRIESNIPAVLSSQGMGECETSCDRLCIMVAGQMTCLGTLQHLRDKFGTGFTMKLVQARATFSSTEGGAGGEPTTKIKSGHALDKDVADLFPGVRVIGVHENAHDYHIAQKLPWSVMFEKVEQLEKSYTLSHVLIQDTSLEQIFVAFATKRHA